MPYQANAYNVMIASPGDVEQERRIARDVIYDWNSLNSATTKIILQPVGWETHSSPEMGDRAQAIINKQVLKNADLLIGIFWTRLGTPTGQSESGSVEEVEEHIKAGKPTMLYFSNQPVVPTSIDQEQYNKLLTFKKSCKDRGLVNEYTTLSEFKENLLRHIILTINENDYFKKTLDVNNDMTQSMPNMTYTEIKFRKNRQGRIAFEISNEAKQLLVEASKSQDGIIMKLRTMSGLIIQTNSKNFIDKRDARLEAIWEDAVKNLSENGLIEAKGYKGEVFAVTKLGYEYADVLIKEKTI